MEKRWQKLTREIGSLLSQIVSEEWQLTWTTILLHRLLSLAGIWYNQNSQQRYFSNPINAEMEDASIENTTDYWYEAVKYCAGGRCYEYTHYWQPLSFPCIECAFNVSEFVAFAIVDFNSWKTFGETTFWKDFMRKIAAFVAIFRKSGWTRPINLSLLRLGPQESSNSDITK